MGLSLQLDMFHLYFFVSEQSSAQDDNKGNLNFSTTSKSKFSNELTKILANKNFNSRILPFPKYNNQMANIQKIKESGPSETKDYRLIRKYDVKQLGSEYRIVDKKHERILLYAEEVFDIIEEVHVATRHGGRDQILSRLRVVYENITRELVMLFIENCEECQKKRKKSGRH